MDALITEVQITFAYGHYYNPITSQTLAFGLLPDSSRDGALFLWSGSEGVSFFQMI